MAGKTDKLGTMKILILHGWTYSTKKWGELVGLLEDAGFKVILPNIPGLTAEIDRPWTIDDYILWLRKLVEKEKGKVILLGHSNGGRISLAYASLFPEKISNLILIDSAGIYHKNFGRKFKRFFFSNLAKIGKKITTSPKLRALLYKVVGERDYHDASPIQRQTMVNLISKDLIKVFSKIKIPTTIIWGKKDKITPLEDAVLMNKTIPNSKLFILDEARHSPMFTNPKQVADIIVKEVS